MRLQQRKAQIELDAEIAEAEAERKAYQENEAIEHREISYRSKERDPNDHLAHLTSQAKVAVFRESEVPQATQLLIQPSLQLLLRVNIPTCLTMRR